MGRCHMSHNIINGSEAVLISHVYDFASFPGERDCGQNVLSV